MDTRDKMGLLAIKRKAASWFRAASLAGLAGSVAAFAWEGAPWAAVACGVCAAMALNASRAVAAVDREMREGEIEEAKEIQALAEREAWREREELRIANIDFDTPAGVFAGSTVYRFAVKDGQRYEYAGIASPHEEPSEDLLIVNDLSYRRMAGA